MTGKDVMMIVIGGAVTIAMQIIYNNLARQYGWPTA